MNSLVCYIHFYNNVPTGVSCSILQSRLESKHVFRNIVYLNIRTGGLGFPWLLQV